MSPEKLLAQLDQQLAHHREREAFHGKQESAHREQRERHAQEAARIAETAETLRASLTAAMGLVAPALAAEARDEEMDTGHSRMLSRLVKRVIEGKSGAERFGASAVTEEVNRRFANLLRQPATIRQVALTLRRQARRGLIHQVRRGKPYHEALYVRERE
jgi:small-conductance mechanosensitive channel